MAWPLALKIDRNRERKRGGEPHRFPSPSSWIQCKERRRRMNQPPSQGNMHAVLLLPAGKSRSEQIRLLDATGEPPPCQTVEVISTNREKCFHGWAPPHPNGLYWSPATEQGSPTPAAVHSCCDLMEEAKPLRAVLATVVVSIAAGSQLKSMSVDSTAKSSPAMMLIPKIRGPSSTQISVGPSALSGSADGRGESEVKGHLARSADERL